MPETSAPIMPGERGEPNATRGWLTRERGLVIALGVITGLAFYLCYCRRRCSGEP